MADPADAPGDGYVAEVRAEPPTFDDAHPGFWSPEGQGRFAASVVGRARRRSGRAAATVLGLGIVMISLSMVVLAGC